MQGGDRLTSKTCSLGKLKREMTVVVSIISYHICHIHHHHICHIGLFIIFVILIMLIELYRLLTLNVTLPTLVQLLVTSSRLMTTTMMMIVTMIIYQMPTLFHLLVMWPMCAHWWKWHGCQLRWKNQRRWSDSPPKIALNSKSGGAPAILAASVRSLLSLSLYLLNAVG